MVGRRLATMLINHPMFSLEMVVGSNEKTGESYREVWETKEALLQQHYGDFWRPYPFPRELGHFQVSSFSDLLASDCFLVFSSIPERAGELEEKLIANGRRVFSNSPYRRFDADVALLVPEVNGVSEEATQLVKYPNCVTSGLVLILAPIHASYGLSEVVVTTYQSLSGRGDAKYARELVIGNIYPLHASSEGTEGFIRREVKKILGNSFPISVTCNRTCVQEGHFVEVKLKTKRPIANAEAVAELLAEFAAHYGGMAVAVGNLSAEDAIFDLRLTYVVNNLVRGAAGGVLLSAEIWAAGLCELQNSHRAAAVNAQMTASGNGA